MESRTTPFDTQPQVSDFTQQLIEESDFNFEITEETSIDKSESLTLHCKAKDLSSQYRIIYSATAVIQKKEIMLYTSFQNMDGSTPQQVWEDIFSYKASVKMNHITPWINGIRDLHDTRAKALNQNGTVAKIGISFAMRLIWSRLRWALDTQHEKKSRLKDKKDQTLFNTEQL